VEKAFLAAAIISAACCCLLWFCTMFFSPRLLTEEFIPLPYGLDDLYRAAR
jgi:hypothetical protein